MNNSEFLPHVCEMVDRGKTVTLVARGFSMRPFIEDRRDKLMLKAEQQYEVGDCALAEYRKGKYLIHRIIDIDGDVVTLQGDGNPISTKEQCLLVDLRAKLIAVERKGKIWTVEGRVWKTYSWFWTHTTFARRYLLLAYRLWTKFLKLNKKR